MGKLNDTLQIGELTRDSKIGAPTRIKSQECGSLLSLFAILLNRVEFELNGNVLDERIVLHVTSSVLLLTLW